MITSVIDARIAQIEQEVATLKAELQLARQQRNWQETFGMFADDPGFDEVVRLGKEIRQSEPPPDEDA